MKTADNHFRGFPALWNVAAFYLFLLHPPPALSSLAVIVLIAADLCSFPRRAPDPRGAAARAYAVADRRLGGACDRHAGERFRRRHARNRRALRDRRLCRGKRCGDPAREIVQGMIELLTSPEAWAALLTLTALEIVLGIDNVIFLSVIVSRIPPAAGEARAADRAGAGAGVPHPAAQPPGVADRPDAGRHHRERHRRFPGATSS